MMTRRIVCMALASVVCSVAADGQRKAQATFGVKGGVVIASVSGADRENFDKSLVGFAAGGFLSVKLASRFALQPELYLVQKGAKAEASDLTGQVRITFIEVPVLAKFIVPTQSSQAKPYFYGGPAIAFRSGCNAKLTAEGTSISSSCDDGEIRVKSTDFSFLLGAGVEIGRALVEARYDLGLSKLGDDPEGSNDVKSRALYLQVGWSFKTAR